VQVFGGMGCCKGLPLERWQCDARICRIFGGTSEIHRGVIAKCLARRGSAVFDLNR
jgi:acyl-CoA dehydrogenase